MSKYEIESPMTPEMFGRMLSWKREVLWQRKRDGFLGEILDILITEVVGSRYMSAEIDLAGNDEAHLSIEVIEFNSDDCRLFAEWFLQAADRYRDRLFDTVSIQYKVGVILYQEDQPVEGTPRVGMASQA